GRPAGDSAVAADRRRAGDHARSAVGGARMGAGAAPPGRQPGRDRPIGAPHPHLSAERPRAAGAASDGARPQRDSRNDMRRLVTMLALSALAARVDAQRLLVPMDDAQSDHLKAYGLTYNALREGLSGEWLLNYRGGAFLLPDTPELRKRAALAGITIEPT